MIEKSDLIFIEHILESISAIAEFSKGITKEALLKERLKQSAIIREIEVLGEAVKNISEKTKKKYAEVRWKEIAGTRDILIHNYFGIDIEIIWNIVNLDIPKLKPRIEKIKDDLNKSN